MAAEVWPGTLPQKLPLATPEPSEPTFIENPRDMGPAFRRHRYSVSTNRLNPPAQNFIFTGPQRTTLLTFYDVTLGYGVKAFEWLNPVPGYGLIDMRMMARPVLVGVRPFETDAGRLYSCAVEFEILHPSDPNAV